MKTKVVNTIIEEMNSTINHYVYNNDLFAGGCCFSAYALAKNLQKLGIKYRVAIFQYNEIINEKVFNNAINGDGVSHVAIEVVYKHRKVMIGDCSGIYRYFSVTGQKYKIRKYTGIKPEEILDGYHNNDWNWCYNRANNGPLMRDINRIAQKYVVEYINEY
jgi:hypothetical protein